MALLGPKDMQAENATAAAEALGAPNREAALGSRPAPLPESTLSSERSSIESEDIETCSMFSDGELAEDAYVEDKAVGSYRIVKSIGGGSSGKVVLAYNTETEERVAIKIVRRKSGELGAEADRRIYREVVISTLLNHPNIVRQLDFLYNDSYFFLVFEYVKGQQLYDAVLRSSFIKEDQARKYFRQIVSAVDYVHRNCICHRDLKIENILIDHNDNVRIIDFGLSNFYDNKLMLKTFCGSLYFAAPELLLGQQYSGPEVDVWSLGVVLYVMLCGKVPFDDESVCVLQGKIKSTRFEFCRALSPQARDLIVSMLSTGDARLSLDDVKKSAWLNIDHEHIVHNYMIARQPIRKLNPECLTALKAVLAFDFDDVEDELRNFVDLCSAELGSLEGIYLTKRPIVSLYYLLVEDYCVRPERTRNFAAEPCTDTSESDEAHGGAGSMPAVLHNFVNFVLAGSHDEVYKRYFIKSVFKRSPAIRPQQTAQPSWPRIRKSYFKGFFKGIRVRNIGSHNALKKTVLDIFGKLEIIYEAKEKSYYCSYFDKDEECFFKISMYYNVILSEYYLNVKLLNSKEKRFRELFGVIQTMLNNRTCPVGAPQPE
ncbi:serine/threonine protein kinase KIN1/2 [Pancytospora philotis]|nr:serine/threonine protein kinase KIN1/2 [Pancytospora philotis]